MTDAPAMWRAELVDAMREKLTRWAASGTGVEYVEFVLRQLAEDAEEIVRKRIAEMIEHEYRSRTLGGVRRDGAGMRTLADVASWIRGRIVGFAVGAPDPTAATVARCGEDTGVLAQLSPEVCRRVLAERWQRAQ